MVAGLTRTRVPICDGPLWAVRDQTRHNDAWPLVTSRDCKSMPHSLYTCAPQISRARLGGILKKSLLKTVILGQLQGLYTLKGCAIICLLAFHNLNPPTSLLSSAPPALQTNSPSSPLTSDDHNCESCDHLSNPSSVQSMSAQRKRSPQDTLPRHRASVSSRASV